MGADRLLPIGAELTAAGVSFRVWAPQHESVEVVIENGDGFADRPAGTRVEGEHAEASTGAQARVFALAKEADGHFSTTVAGLRAGALYRFRIDGSEPLYPDPASRAQPAGPHGPSCVIDPASFAWDDDDWPGLTPAGQVVYELHLGTFTKEGSVRAAMAELDELAALGITVVELMPIADFPGDFGWGYDGVNLFAPCRLYGEPDDYRRFVARAHALGIGVILDVVYNHFGPDGNYLSAFCADYVTDRYGIEWGDAINFDGENAQGVREFYRANAAYWISEFHFDGFRLDATQDIHDASPTHILAEVGRAARAAAGAKSLLIVAENEPQDVRHVRAVEDGGFGLDALWNDDLHHALIVRLTGHNEAYYTDYAGSAQEFVSALKWGYLYQGQRYAWQKQRRGTPTRGLPPSSFVSFLQNHDQIANSSCGLRIAELTSPGLLRAATAMIVLSRAMPLLFQGQEFAAQAPFLYFADHGETLSPLIAKGRREFLAQFPSFASISAHGWQSEPGKRETFERCKLDFADRERHRPLYQMHKDLLRLRREDRVLSAPTPGDADGAVLGDEVFVMRYFAGEERSGDRLLLVNFGIDWRPARVPEPLLAPPPGMRWRLVWSSEDPSYGGCGALACTSEDGGWFMQGQAACFLIAEGKATASK